MTRIAVIGHVEWVTFADGDVPAPGEIALLADPFAVAAGAGAVVAVELAEAGVEAMFYTALGRDAAGDASQRFLAERGVERITLTVSEANDGAIRLYHDLGYVVAGRSPADGEAAVYLFVFWAGLAALGMAVTGAIGLLFFRQKAQ